MAADLRVATGSQDAHAALIDVYEELRGPLTNRGWWEMAGYLRFPPTQPTGWPAGRRPAYRSARPACEPVTPSD
jgi:hypothetical protein